MNKLVLESFFRLFQTAFLILVTCYFTTAHSQEVKIVNVEKGIKTIGFGSKSKTAETLDIRFELTRKVDYLDYCGMELTSAQTDSGEFLTANYGFINPSEILMRRLYTLGQRSTQDTSLHYPKKQSTTVILEGSICFFDTKKVADSRILLQSFYDKEFSLIESKNDDDLNLRIAYFNSENLKKVSKVADKINMDSDGNVDARKKALISEFGNPLGELLNEYYLYNGNSLSYYDNNYPINILAADKFNRIAKISALDEQGEILELKEYSDSPWHNEKTEVRGLLYYASFYETPPKNVRLEIQTTVKNKLKKIPFKLTFQVPDS